MTPARTISFDAPTISPFTPPKTLRESTSISAVMAAVAARASTRASRGSGSRNSGSVSRNAGTRNQGFAKL